MDKRVSSVRKLVLGAAFLAMTAMTGIPVGSTMAIAQETTTAATEIDPVAVERGFAVWKKQDCIGCHGWAGNGERIGENPTGPSLRALDYDAATLKETILCGRPGTPMPYHDPRAYKDDRCFGMTAADVGTQQLIKGKAMTSAEADDLVSYMLDSMLGRPDQPNQDECRAYYGAKPFCAKYPAAEAQAQ
jgi:mono/diheme cytochrome c family protein